MKTLVSTSFLGTRPSCLPSPGRPFFLHRRPKTEFMTGLAGQPSKKVKTQQVMGPLLANLKLVYGVEVE